MTDLREGQDEEEWHAWRRAGVTASDIAEAVGGTYGGIYAVVAGKLERTPPVEQNAAMERGHRWQPVIADAVHILTGYHVVGEEEWVECGDDPRWRCTIDGLLAESSEATLDEVAANLEVKTYGSEVSPSWARWVAQTDWQMLCTGAPRTLIAAARINDTLDVCEGIALRWVEADASRQSQLLPVAEEIWAHVQAGTLPDPDVPAALDIVKAVWPAAELEEPVAVEAELVARRTELKAAVKEAEAELDVIDARLRDAIGAHSVGLADGYRVNVSQAALTMTEEAAAELLAEHPEWGKTVLDRSAVPKDVWKERSTRVGARRLTTKEDKK